MPRGLGSVRELQNFVECAVIRAQGSELCPGCRAYGY